MDTLQGVREALAHLHDVAYLETHPLGRRSPAGRARGAGAALQASLLDAVASLRPPRGAPPDPHGARAYELLRLRYVEAMAVDRVRAALALSHSEYYRDHNRALAAVASLLSGAARPAPTESTRARHDVPRPAGALTPLLGRDEELGQVRALLEHDRLVTVTGLGGIGKTRLARAVAEEPSGLWSDGAFFVELAPLAREELVADAVRRGVGAEEQPSGGPLSAAMAALGARRVLLVLDNCEHVAAGAAAVAEELLRGCPGLRVLATSREPLGVDGEVRCRLAPLALPPEGVAPALGEFAALDLFLDRARRARPELPTDEATVMAAARVCRLLGGVPLAIELAAARVGGLGVGELAERLAERIDLAGGGARAVPARQRSLRAALDWSYELLDLSEQRLFRRLAVFPGGFTITAAEAVCASGAVAREEVADLLLRLVDKSLVQPRPEAAGPGRYELLEPVRQYAIERLAADGEGNAVRDRHAAWCVAAALEGRRSGAARAGAAWELANVRAALGWLIETGNARDGLRLVGAQWGRPWRRGHMTEGRGWLTRLLAMPGASEAGEARVDALVAAAGLAIMQDHVTAQPLCDELMAMAETLDQRGWALCLRGLLALRRGDYPSAQEALARSAELARGADDPTLRPVALRLLGDLGRAVGDYPTAQRALKESLALAREVGDPVEIAFTLFALGQTAYNQGDYERAGDRWRESMRQAVEAGDRSRQAQAALGLAKYAHAVGDHVEARARCEEALDHFRALGHHGLVPDVFHHLGLIAHDAGDAPAAQEHYREALRLRLEIGIRRLVAESLEALAGLAVAQGRYDDGLRLLGAAAAGRESMADRPPPIWRPRIEDWAERAHAALGPNAAAAWDAGRATSLEEAARAVLDKPSP